MPDDQIGQLLLDECGRLWFGTREGICMFPPGQLDAFDQGSRLLVDPVILGTDEGAGSPECMAGYGALAARGPDGTLWFCKQEGLASVVPARVAASKSALPVRIASLRVGAAPPHTFDVVQPSPTLPPIIVTYPPPPIEFVFRVLEYAAPERVRFRYRLDPLDSVWSPPTAQPQLTFDRLPPGEYRLHVAAFVNGATSQTVAPVVVRVVMPLWRRPDVLVVLAALAAAALTGGLRVRAHRRLQRRLKRIEAEWTLERERDRIARDMHDELGAKLTRLSYISEVEAGKPSTHPAAQSRFRDLAELARETIRSLEQIVWTADPRNDAAAELVKHLCRYAEDYLSGTGVECRFDVPSPLPLVRLHPETRRHVFSAFKEALANVLQHSGAQTVDIRVHCRPAELEVEVEDDGHGFDAAAVDGKGNGLANMRERMRLGGGHCDIRSQPDAGTRIVFRVPLGNGKAEHTAGGRTW